ncbi:hypothetical protein IMSAG049_00239 [Clostridiales bacterium]|nr:hypothetical protein IMSAG049_00239 [Clostridiales bacterium]
MRKTVKTLLEQENLTADQRNEILKWETILDELDHTEALNERRHKGKRDLLDLSLMECDDCEEFIATKILLRICRSDSGWLEWIFSKKASDLYQLVGSESISNALQSLTYQQKQVLFLLYVRRFSTEEAAAKLGSSSRNIRKHKERALKNIRKCLSGKER